MAAGARRGWRLLLGSIPILLAGCQGIDPTPNDEPVSEADRARFVKHRVEDARAFRVQKRFDAAERQLRLALSQAPDDARAHALMARTLHDLGRDGEAAPHVARARALSPPPPPPPETPLVPDASGVLFVLLPPELEHHGAIGRSGEWEDPRAPRVLARRLRTRLPKAGVTEASPASVRQAEQWLRAQAPRSVVSVRVDQVVCGESAKDGPFALVALTVAAARSGALPDEPVRVRATDDDPALPPACTDAALAHALEQALALPGVVAALHAPARPAKDTWSALAVRTLFPRFDANAEREIALARAEARDHGAAVDAAAVMESAELERARERALDVARANDPRDPETEALEAEVADERRQRDELLAALRVDELALRSPTAEEIAVLRVVAARQPEGVGMRLARERAGGGEVEARELRAPSGELLARFYFQPGAREPLLREEDSDLDGIPDRWTAYAGGRPKEVWEDRGGSGQVNAHILLAADGVSKDTIEIDMDGDGRSERVFHYRDGVLVGAEQDANGDGRLDRFERFDAAGAVTERDDDLDGDGTVDVHSEFRNGKLLRREIHNAAPADPPATSPSPMR